MTKKRSAMILLMSETVDAPGPCMRVRTAWPMRPVVSAALPGGSSNDLGRDRIMITRTSPMPLLTPRLVPAVRRSAIQGLVQRTGGRKCMAQNIA